MRLRSILITLIWVHLSGSSGRPFKLCSTPVVSFCVLLSKFIQQPFFLEILLEMLPDKWSSKSISVVQKEKKKERKTEPKQLNSLELPLYAKGTLRFYCLCTYSFCLALLGCHSKPVKVLNDRSMEDLTIMGFPWHSPLGCSPQKINNVNNTVTERENRND